VIARHLGLTLSRCSWRTAAWTPVSRLRRA
jgi:hypothetical protein